MEVEIRHFEPVRLAAIRHLGPYYEIGQAFGQLGEWLQAANVPAKTMIGVYYDDPSVTPAAELRSEAGVVVAADFPVSDPTVHIVELIGGDHAVAVHRGPYSGLPQAWARLYSEWLPQSGRTPANAPSFEIYGHPCEDAADEEIATELCIPLI